MHLRYHIIHNFTSLLLYLSSLACQYFVCLLLGSFASYGGLMENHRTDKFACHLYLGTSIQHFHLEQIPYLWQLRMQLLLYCVLLAQGQVCRNILAIKSNVNNSLKHCEEEPVVMLTRGRCRVRSQATLHSVCQLIADCFLYKGKEL